MSIARFALAVVAANSRRSALDVGLIASTEGLLGGERDAKENSRISGCEAGAHMARHSSSSSSSASAQQCLADGGHKEAVSADEMLISDISSEHALVESSLLEQLLEILLGKREGRSSSTPCANAHDAPFAQPSSER